MRRRKPSENGMMEEAIEKASQLINLLQKENHDLKKKVELLEGELEMANRRESDSRNSKQELEDQANHYEKRLKENQTQMEEIKNKLSTTEENLKRKIGTNKELHQKLAVLNAKLKEKIKEGNEDKTKLLSIKNQNEYLLKKLGESEEKENQAFMKVNFAQKDVEKELKEMQKLKEAFARRCQELKIDNAALTQAAAEYKQKYLDAQQLKRVVKNIKHDEMVREQVRMSPKYDLHLEKLIKQSIGVTPNSTIEGQIDQIASFICYRFAHIEKMWQSLVEKMQTKQWKKIDNLKDLNFICQRLYSYVSQLVNQQS